MDFQRLNERMKAIGELLAEPHMDPDPDRDDWSLHTQATAEAGRLVNEMLDSADPDVNQIVDPEEQQYARVAVAELAGNAAALLYAGGRSDAAVQVLTRSRRLVQGLPQETLYDAAVTDARAYTVYVRAWWLLNHDQRREAMSLASAARSEVPPVIAKELQQVLDAPKPIESAPSLFALNGFGLQIYGTRNPQPNGIYATTRYLTALFIPILPIDSYLVSDEGDSAYRFYGKVRPPMYQRIWRLAAVVGVLGLIGWMFINNYLNSPERLLRLEIAEAEVAEEQGNSQEALGKYEAVLDEWSSSATQTDLQPAVDGFVRLICAEVEQPLTTERVDEVARVVQRFEALPPEVRDGGASSPMVEQIEIWAEQVGSNDERSLGAALRLLNAAVRVAPQTDAERLDGRRATLKRTLADRIIEEWPLDALRQYVDLQNDAEAIERAARIFEDLPDDPSIWIELQDVATRWSAEAERQDYGRTEELNALLKRRVETARAHVESAERKSLLEANEERSLRIFLRKHPTDQEIAIAVVGHERARGNPQAAHETLTALGAPGHLVPDTQFVLASVYAELGREADAEAMLERMLSIRLPEFEEARARYEMWAGQLRDRLIARAQRGDLPADLRSRLEAASESQQANIFGEWMDNELEKDFDISRMRDRYAELSDVVPAVLTLGMIKLRRANAAGGAERDALLVAAERAFMSIQGEAQGVATYHLSLGQVYHRLGKTEQGETEFAALLARNDDGLALAVAGAYRELGLEARSREVNMAVYERGSSEARQQAAVSLALLASDREEQRNWLRKADPEDEFVRNSLLELEADEALERGELETAAEKYHAVAESFKRRADHDSSSANNASLAMSRGYECSGELEDLDEAILMMQKARSLSPENPLVLGNLSSLLSFRAQIKTLERWIRTRPLRLTQSDADTLINALTRGPERDAVLTALRKDGDMHQSLELARQAEVLAPGSWNTYTHCLSWHGLNRDVKALSQLAERLRQVPNLDTSSYTRMRQTYIDGTDLDQRREDADNALSRAGGRMKEAQRSGHRPTVAAATLLKGQALFGKAQLDARYETAMEAAAVYSESDRLWSSLGARGESSEALMMAAIFKAAERNDTLRQTWETDARRLGPKLIIHNLLEAGDASAVSALREQSELAETLVIRRQLSQESSGLFDWIIGRLAGDTDLEARGLAAMSRPDLIARDEIRLILDPSSEAERLRLDLRRRE